MKKVIIPSVIVLIVAVAALSLGTFTGDGQSVLISDTAKECTKTAAMASGKECGEKVRAASASEKRECGDKVRAAMASERKECGEKATATKASNTVECPYSGAVIHTDSDEKKSCDDKSSAVHASAGEIDKDEACCEKHAMAVAD